MRNWLVFLVGVLFLACSGHESAEAGSGHMGADEYESYNVNGGRSKGAKGWAGQVDIVPGATDNQQVAQANFSEPGQYTVQFSVVDPNDAAHNRNRCKATVIWKVSDGFTITRQVTLASGSAMSVTGVGQGVEVFAQDNIQVSVPAGAVPYTVFATISKGNRGTDTTPPVLMPDGNSGGAVAVSAGNHVDFPVPQGVGIKSVYVQMFPNTNDGPILEGTAYVEQLNTFEVISKYDPRTFQWVPLVAGAQTIRVINVNATSGGPTHNVAFLPIFGIDG